MKKIHFVNAAAILGVLLLPSCRFIRISDDFKQEIRENIPAINSRGANDAERITANDNIITRSDVTGDFHAVQSTLPADITYLPGPCAITLQGPDNVLSHISVKNDRGTLLIATDGTTFRNLKHLEIRISSPVLERISFNGAVDFEAPQGITALDFKAEINGAGDLEIQGLRAGNASITINGAGDADISALECDRLEIAINGAGDATLAGRAGRASLAISGAGNIDASRLSCPDLDTQVRGIGRIIKP